MRVDEILEPTSRTFCIEVTWEPELRSHAGVLGTWIENGFCCVQKVFVKRRGRTESDQGPWTGQNCLTATVCRLYATSPSELHCFPSCFKFQGIGLGCKLRLPKRLSKKFAAGFRRASPLRCMDARAMHACKCVSSDLRHSRSAQCWPKSAQCSEFTVALDSGPPAVSLSFLLNPLQKA